MDTEISRHEVAVCQVLRSVDGWIANDALAKAANVAPRTAQSHTKHLTELGLVECLKMYDGYRFRWSANAAERNPEYLVRIDKAAAVFGIKVEGTKIQRVAQQKLLL